MVSICSWLECWRAPSRWTLSVGFVLAAFGCGPQRAELGPCEEGFAELVQIANAADLLEMPRVNRVRRLEIIDSDLSTLKGLDCIEWVETLRIEDNEDLRDLHGLESLAVVALEDCDEPWAPDDCQEYPYTQLGLLIPPGVADAIIAGNPRLETMAGLDALTFVAGTLEIRDNASLVSLDGLQSLTTVAWVDKSDRDFPASALRIEQNPKLRNLDGLTAYRGGWRLEVKGNATMTHLFPPRPVFRDHLSFEAPGALARRALFEDLPALVSLDGLTGWWVPRFELRRVPLLEQLPAMTVGREPELEPGEYDDRFMLHLAIESNPALRSLKGVPPAALVSGSLIIRDNDALVDLAGLESLEVVARADSVIEYAVLIEGNDALANLDALDPTIAGAFRGHTGDTSAIRDNPMLPECRVYAFLDAIYDIPVEDVSSWIVEGNAGGTCP